MLIAGLKPQKQPILFHAPTKDLNNNTITEMVETYKNSMRGCNQNQNKFTFNAMQNTMQFIRRQIVVFPVYSLQHNTLRVTDRVDCSTADTQFQNTFNGTVDTSFKIW